MENHRKILLCQRWRSHIKIHAEDALRITKEGIKGGKREIELRHEHQIHKPNITYKVGYFKTMFFRKDKTDKSFYLL